MRDHLFQRLDVNVFLVHPIIRSALNPEIAESMYPNAHVELARNIGKSEAKRALSLFHEY